MFGVESNFINAHFISEYFHVLITFASQSIRVNLGTRIMNTRTKGPPSVCVCVCVCVCTHAQHIQVCACELQNHLCIHIY